MSETTDPTAGEGLSEAERRDLFNAWVATGTPTDWEHAVERIVAARESAAATRARAEALREAADALNIEGVGFKEDGWGSNPTDQQTIDVMVKAIQWLRARADSLAPDTAGGAS